MENRGSQIWAIVMVMVTIAGAYYFLNASSEKETSNGAAYQTAYAVFCTSPATALGDCDIKDTAVAVNFKVDVENQRVFRWYEGVLEGNHTLLENCIVIDKNNWNCDSAPGNQHGVKNGYSNGTYFERSGPTISQSGGYLLSVTKNEWEGIHERLYPTN